MIETRELIEIKGGASSTLLNTVVKVITAALELGRTVGTIIRRTLKKNAC